jgi:asparagine synthase (glutamine-hydrolysing)
VCGIAGQVRSGGAPVAPSLVHAMCAALEHRGPDSRGVHVAPGVGLGIQRLRVIDLATGDQPLFNEDGSVAVVLNGEIYNYRELRERLVRSGHTFSSSGDTEVIAHLYEEEGPACVRSLHGMFAFALWDARRRQLLVARDRVGKKPLFYCERDGALSFASELTALMEDGEVPRDVDPQAIDCFLTYTYVPAPLSAFRAVRKLPPASALVWRDGRVKIERYWRLDYRHKLAPASEEELGERVRAEIRAAVRRRLISDVPLGAFLSGGIDSSAVVAAMAEASAQPVKTFSIGFENDRFNELPHARRIAGLFATDHHEFVVRPDAVSLLPRLVRHYGEPFGDHSAIPSFLLAGMARRHVTVALNGDGGDEAFGGYGRYVTHARLASLARVPRPARLALGRALARVPSDGELTSARSRLNRISTTLSLDPEMRYVASVSRAGWALRAEAYSGEFRAAIDDEATADVIRRPWLDSTAPSLVDRMLGVDVDTYLPGDLLVKMDIATMAHALEARSPLLDHQLLELAASIPGRSKVDRGEKKIALRAALREWLPDDILDRPKQGFQVPMADWFRSDLGGLARELLLDPAARERGYLRPGFAEDLLRRHQERRADNSALLWSLLVLESWHREVVDRPSTGRNRALAA